MNRISIIAASLSLVSSIASAGSHSMLTREAQLADVRVAETDYVARSGAFSGQRRMAAEAMLRDLTRRAGTLSSDQFSVSMMRLAAIADNAHDYTFFTPPGGPATRLPMLLLWFPDGLIVARGAGSSSNLAGDRIVEIEGRSPEALYRRAKPLFGGLETMRKMQLAFALGSQGVLHTLGLARHTDRLRMTFRTPSGGILRRTVRFVPKSILPPIPEPQQIWFPDLPRPGGWTSAPAASTAPLALREPGRWFRTAPLPKLNASYVQFRTNFSEDGEDISSFVKQTLGTLTRERPDNIVLDLRLDLGGDLQTTLGFMRALPNIARKRVYVLIGRYTFSAGITSVAAVKKAGGLKVMLVGEPVGDRMRFWSEGGQPVCLPNAHICFVPRVGMFDLAHGCAGERGCYGDKWGLNIGPIVPELSAPFTAHAYLTGHDPGMEAVAGEILKARSHLPHRG
jgi:hypothetical protein